MRKKIIEFSAIILVVTAQLISAAGSDTEWDRTVLPRPPQPFQGVTKRTLEGSVASFAEPVKPPPGAPNIPLVSKLSAQDLQRIYLERFANAVRK